MYSRYLFNLLFIAFCFRSVACFSDTDVEIYSQIAYSKKSNSKFKIDDKNPYRAENGYNDWLLKVSNRTRFLDDKLTFDLSLYALAYYPVAKTQVFEQDANRRRFYFNKLNINFNFSDSFSFTVGKITNPGGVFYFKSPASLINNYHAGFKTSRIYHLSMSRFYSESSWGVVLAKDTTDYTLSATLTPKLASIGNTAKSAENWSNLARSNSQERYLISYTDYRFKQHTPTINVLAGNQKSIALGNSYSIYPQLVFNSEIAWHQKQQWRHMEEKNILAIENYQFSDSLYKTKAKQGFELALGIEYTTNYFSQFGLEYYFQSEGYSRKQWKQQANAINFLNQKTGYLPLKNAFDDYKYLMASEIYNVSSQGFYLGKHYLNGYSSILMEDQSKLQPWFILNLIDKSSLLGISYSKPLDAWDGKLNFYIGMFTAIGSRDTEFGLFGQSLTNYLGINYKF